MDEKQFPSSSYPPIPSNAANLTPWTKSNFLAVTHIGELRGTVEILKSQFEHPNHVEVQVQSLGIGGWRKRLVNGFASR